MANAKVIPIEEKALIPGTQSWRDALLTEQAQRNKHAIVGCLIDFIVRVREIEDDNAKFRTVELKAIQELRATLNVGGPLSKAKKSEIEVELNAIGRRIWQRRQQERREDEDPAADGDRPVDRVAK